MHARRRDALFSALSSIDDFSRIVLHRPLRSYQLPPARAIIDSVRHGRGLTLAVMMARQAGKNERPLRWRPCCLTSSVDAAGIWSRPRPHFGPRR